MQQLAQKGYTEENVINILHAKNNNRNIKFKYLLLDINNSTKAELENVIDAEINFKSLANIKRGGKFLIKESDDINIDWLNDRIQPFIMLKVPNSNTWLEWSLGVYLLSSPKRKSTGKNIIRDVEAYDLLLILSDEKIDKRYLVPKGKKYTDEIKELITGSKIYQTNITSSSKTLRSDKEFEIGTSKLTIINQLLAEINYTSIWTDERGYLTSAPYTLPSYRTKDYEYFNDELSIINGMEEEMDTFNVPNKFIVVCTNPDSEPLVSTYTNDKENSPTSTKNRHRIITSYKEIDDIADQQSLDAYTKRTAEEASNIYGHITFNSAIMPHHSFQDCLYIKHDGLGINNYYIETEWSMKLNIGALMNHKVRRVIQV
ncbi:hypothetical protein SH1V18_14870 [Vallitalea longa]|uniref:UBA domain-containing protein n=2 Tax=Vallitalea longa TaxID=2936439 RepID=A0A9W5Y8W0_9FIRM|nr:hypothetical protein SH1V18_14870 [Vallitalea longa]